MKKLIFLASLILISTLSKAQNLVNNPSFENVNLANLNCSWYLTNSEFMAAVQNWNYPTTGSTDLFHMSLATTCFGHPLSTNTNSYGNQLPHTGNAMSNITVYGNGGCTPYREYLQGTLSTPLQIGTTYQIEMYVSLADKSNKGTDNIGVKFFQNSQSVNSMCVWSNIPDVNYTGTPITDKDNWTLLTFQYTPTVSNLNYFCIGNFLTDSATNTTNVIGTRSTISYFIDDISITPLTNTNTPIFNQIGPICFGDTFVLPSTSINGISGTWSPAIDYTQTTTYTFTPFSNTFNTIQMTVEVNQNEYPSFNQISPICQGNVLNLPTTSLEGIEGIWTPSVNNQQTTTYTFIPNNSCATQVQMTITVNPKETPTFNQIPPICAGESFTLPISSLENIQGIWSPQINNQQTTSYTFTPNNNCANSTQMTVIVNQIEEPIFEDFSNLCYGDNNFSLPTISNNNILGTWNPQFNNTTSGTYTFTPNENECSTTKTISINILNDFNFSLYEYCVNEDLILQIEDPSNSFIIENSNFNWTINSNSIINSSSSINLTSIVNSLNLELPLEISVEVTNENGCIKTKETEINSIYCKIPKGISPNSDFKNDTFDLSLLNVKHLSIFNRYGIKVYERDNYKNEWDGSTNNRQKLPTGVYYYVIELDFKTLTGWVYLNR